MLHDSPDAEQFSMPFFSYLGIARSTRIGNNSLILGRSCSPHLLLLLNKDLLWPSTEDTETSRLICQTRNWFDLELFHVSLCLCFSAAYLDFVSLRSFVKSHSCCTCFLDIFQLRERCLELKTLFKCPFYIVRPKDSNQPKTLWQKEVKIKELSKPEFSKCFNLDQKIYPPWSLVM